MRLPALPSHSTVRRVVAAITVIGCVGATTACKTSPSGSDGPSLFGTWNATSVVFGGMDWIAEGMSLSVTLTSGGDYTISVQQDLLEFCETSTECDNDGTFVVSGNILTFDPGEIDPATFTYTLTDTTLMMTGSIEGFPVSFTLVRA